MTITFSPAKREQVKLRAALIGPPGSGKTKGALWIARALGGRWFGIDTEHDRMKLYADEFVFEHGNLPPTMQSPEGYVEAVRTAVAAGADGIIIDSLSHEWLSILEEADRFSNWKDLTPRHKGFIEAIVNAPAHVIVTMRAKVKYDVSEVEVGGRKKQKIERIGVGPVQREGVEYEFDIVGYLDETHRATFLNRCDALVGQTLPILADPPGSEPEAVPIILKWLEEGEPDPDMQRAPEDKIAELRALLAGENISDAVVEDQFQRQALKSGGVLTLGWVEEKIAAAHERARGGARVETAKAPVPKTWGEVELAVSRAFGAVVVPDFEAFVVQAAEVLYGKPVDKVFGNREGNLTRAEWATLQQKAAGACAALLDTVQREFPPPSRAEMQAAWATVLKSPEPLEGPYWQMGPDEEDRPARRSEDAAEAEGVGVADADPVESSTKEA